MDGNSFLESLVFDIHIEWCFCVGEKPILHHPIFQGTTYDICVSLSLCMTSSSSPFRNSKAKHTTFDGGHTDNIKFWAENWRYAYTFQKPKKLKSFPLIRKSFMKPTLRKFHTHPYQERQEIGNRTRERETDTGAQQRNWEGGRETEGEGEDEEWENWINFSSNPKTEVWFAIKVAYTRTHTIHVHNFVNIFFRVKTLTSNNNSQTSMDIALNVQFRWGFSSNLRTKKQRAHSLVLFWNRLFLFFSFLFVPSHSLNSLIRFVFVFFVDEKHISCIGYFQSAHVLFSLLNRKKSKKSKACKSKKIFIDKKKQNRENITYEQWTFCCIYFEKSLTHLSWY